MSSVAHFLEEMEYVLKPVMQTIDRAILMIPAAALDFKPSERCMSVAELAIHIYRGCYFLSLGIKKGRFTENDFELQPPLAEELSSPEEIVRYGEKVKEVFQEVISHLTNEDLERLIQFDFTKAKEGHFAHGWGKWTIKGSDCLRIILVESLHHRGQLSSYLRIMGLRPPHIYPPL